MGEISAGIIGITTGCLALAYIISLPVFYGLFSFKKDWDNWECYASQDHDILVPWSNDFEDPPEDYHNVSANFQMVNLWGFINFTAPIALMIVCGLPACFCDCTEVVAIITACLFAMSYISHFFTMIVMRWRHAGRVCAGDFDS